MPRAINYEEKMRLLKEKIEKKTEEIKNLKALAAELEQKKLKSDFQALNEYLSAKGINPDEALNKLKEVYGE